MLSNIDKITGVFCKRALKKRKYSANETCNFIDATNGRHSIVYTLQLYLAFPCAHQTMSPQSLQRLKRLSKCCIHVCIYTHMSYKHTHRHVYIHTHVHMQIHTQTYTHTHTHTCKYTHTHTRTPIIRTEYSIESGLML